MTPIKLPRKGAFKPGDRVRVGDRRGVVLDIGAFYVEDMPVSKWVEIKLPDNSVSHVEKHLVEHDYEYLYRELAKKINHSK